MHSVMHDHASTQFEVNMRRSQFLAYIICLSTTHDFMSDDGLILHDLEQCGTYLYFNQN